MRDIASEFFQTLLLTSIPHNFVRTDPDAASTYFNTNEIPVFFETPLQGEWQMNGTFIRLSAIWICRIRR